MNIRKRNKNHANKNTIYSRQFDFETTLIKFRILQLLSYNILCILYTSLFPLYHQHLDGERETFTSCKDNINSFDCLWMMIWG